MSWFRPTNTLVPAIRAVPERKISSVPIRIFAACFTSTAVAVNYTNYSPLITTMRAALHISSGQVGLLSTLLFLGLAIAYIPSGMLADRFGARPVLFVSTTLLAGAALALPLIPNLTWILVCRLLVGLGSGGAFIAGAGIAASLGKHSSLGQGLYGGATQIGSGMGLLITPHLLTAFGWRGSFFAWGLFSVIAIVLWLFIYDGSMPHQSHTIDIKAGLRSPSVWTLGLSHLGTFGLGNAIAAWLTIYLVTAYHLPLTLAATLGSFALLTGMFFRPLGGILIARGIIRSIPLLRIGTIMGFLGVGILILPLYTPLFAIIGISLIAIGATIPYTAVFNPAAHLRTVSKGVAQGMVSVLSSPTVIIGPPLIGFLLDRTGSFSWAFSPIMLFGLVAIIASFLAQNALQKEATMPF